MECGGAESPELFFLRSKPCAQEGDENNQVSDDLVLSEVDWGIEEGGV